jgi:nitroreductase
MTPENFNKLVENRRSVRQYTPKMPPDEWLEEMLRAAQQAPSPSNTQPVRFIRLMSEKIRKHLFETMQSTRETYLKMITSGMGSTQLKNVINYYWRYSVFMFDAPVLFAAGTVETKKGLAFYLKNAGFIEEDFYGERNADISLGLAMKGFILKAVSLGLGTCILTAPLCFIPRIHEIIDTEKMTVKCFITVGFAAQEPPPTDRKPMKDIFSVL